jgi:predicted nucleic-acid-binding protein
MIGLDTNVVVRILTQDDPDQLRRAAEAIGAQCSTDDPGWIDCIVLVEVIWVLSSAYHYSRGEIVVAIEKLLQVRELEIQYVDEAWEALHLYRDHPADFSDYYLAAINRGKGCRATLTFDGKAGRSELFSLI